MTHRERFLCALNRKQPDKVPIFENWIDKPIIEKLSKLLGIDAKNYKKEDKSYNGIPYIELFCNVLEKLDLDAISYVFSTGNKNISPKQSIDKYGRIFNLSPHGEPLPAEPRIKSISDANNFNMSSMLNFKDFSELQLIIKRFGQSRAYCMVFNDPYKESWRTVGGMENLLLNFGENPELVHRVLRITTDFALKAIDIAVSIGIGSFMMVGDFAFETGLLFSLEDYRRFLKQLHMEIVEHVHSKGALIAKHSDGNFWDLLDDWIEVGFDGIHPIQPQCMDIKKTKDYVNGKMAVLGNIDCRTLLVSGSEEEVRETVKATIKDAAPGGGYLISSSNSIHPGCKAENYIAMIEAAHKYGVYL